MRKREVVCRTWCVFRIHTISCLEREEGAMSPLSLLFNRNTLEHLHSHLIVTNYSKSEIRHDRPLLFYSYSNEASHSVSRPIPFQHPSD